MASAVSISDNELQEIKRNHSQKNGQALQIIYKWQEKNPNSSIEELQKFLFSVGEPHAANRFVNGNLCYYRTGANGQHGQYFVSCGWGMRGMRKTACTGNV